MDVEDLGAVGAMTPPDVWDSMATMAGAMLIDVRTQAEWAFVGTADTSSIARPQCFIEWTTFPAMARNTTFLTSLDEAIEKHGATALFFLCRSGGRSHDAAVATAEHRRASDNPLPCINVLEGFEGPVDPQGHRGMISGWKARGLPWQQA